jgi:putative ABC transport system ATP-binding protein
MLLEAQALQKTYPDGTRALREATFGIDTGEFVAIMGPSGSGKSTLLHILGFLDPQSGGTYRFQGKTWDDLGPQHLAELRNTEIGFVFQQFNLLPRETVLENIYLPLYYSSVPSSVWKVRAEAAANAVDLSHRLDHAAYLLSGGEKQRVAIARALINEPKVIFADEPTGNLDTKTGTGVMNILTSLNEQGHTVIVITHDEEIAAYAKRQLTIRDGELVSDTQTS